MKSRCSGWLFAALPALLLAACGPAPVPPTPSAPQPTIVSLTFDDGDADNYDSAAVLTQFDLKATWYVPSGLVGTPGYMTWDQLEQLRADGHEIGGHSLDHVNIDGLESSELRRQVCDDRQALQARGFEALSFAYPYGGYDDAARAMVQECGYLSARTIGAGPDVVPPSDPFRLRAYPYILGDTSFAKLQRYVTGTRREGGGWLILIFHHVCDACDTFSVQPEVLHRFIAWLAEEQARGRVQVATIGEVIAGGGR